MLVTIHSTAAPEVAVLRDLAQYLLGLLGKRIGERGVIAAEELPEAISRLEAAISEDKALHAASGGVAENSADRNTWPSSLAQRAYPLLDMMRVAQREHADILWGV
ncbi:DUF1840 domain-containing protein [Cupriavidus pinatubonensis]|uniref:DUF1840 domain-containing protein n=1 Tax=Cupriavidus pinatubonensis TaxID=248026 RepID=A0ABN7Z7E0_9BURK|nr:DUF1840 domain-containing protein [Cupriavidus pinatubonensis]CAG9180750.1 hypothetical protein LMG23994_04483 [Cupriavidus pinatubonensis]